MKNETYTEKVYRGVKQDLLSGKIQVNEFLVEKEIADQYAVSKGTAAEALHRLCLEGVLTSYPRKGYLLSVLGEEEFFRIQRLRFHIELLVVNILIASKTEEELRSLYPHAESRDDSIGKYYSANTNFHMSMAELTGDSYIENTLITLIESLSRTKIFFRVVSMPESEQYHHVQLVDQLVARNLEGARRCLAEDMKLPEDLYR